MPIPNPARMDLLFKPSPQYQLTDCQHFDWSLGVRFWRTTAPYSPTNLLTLMKLL